MVLATHFHDEIVRQAITSPILIVAGLALAAVGVVRLARRRWWLAIALGTLVAATGVYRLVEVPALRHNHLCHAHNFNPCRGDNAHDDDGHTHWFGRRAAKPQ
jgi:hypothetical protein